MKLTKPSRRVRRNDTPKPPRAVRTLAIYIRAKSEVVERIRKIANDRGRPHTFASVAGELLDKATANPPIEEPKP